MADTASTTNTGRGGGITGGGDRAFGGNGDNRPLAVITGASSGIGFELARVSALNGFDLVVAADSPKIKEAGQHLSKLGTDVRAVQADLDTEQGVDTLYNATKALNRPIDVLCANAGRGLGGAFLDQDWQAIKRVSTPTSSAPAISCTNSDVIWLIGTRAVSSLPVRLPVSSQARIRPFTMALRLSWTASPRRFAMRSQTRA